MNTLVIRPANEKFENDLIEIIKNIDDYAYVYARDKFVTLSKVMRVIEVMDDESSIEKLYIALKTFFFNKITDMYILEEND